ncbi:MAG: hypothetical protein EHM41_18710 [Chloroflexi bacterium]|nr:MAG: hypothetical protein EHM41_18710 [Chloroflexota bacterium]
MKNKQLNNGFNRVIVGTALLVIFTLILAACSPADSTTEAEAPPAETEAAGVPATGDEEAINVASDPTLGDILVDGDGMTLYMFANDEPNISNCTGGCLENWPPLVTQGTPVLGDGVDESLIGTAPLADGSMVVTYNSMPLYNFAGDTAPGDVNGQGSNDVWFVVAPDGNPVGMQ